MNEKVKNIIIEEFNRVDSAFKTFRNNLKINNKIANCIELDLLENLVKEVIDNYKKYQDSQQDLINGKDEYIAKLCNDRAELKEQLKQVEDFKYHYDRYKKEIANNLKVINCMQEEETTNRNLIDSLEDRNDKLVERLEKQKSEINELKEFAKLIRHCIQFRDDKIVFWTIEKNAINTNLGTRINEYECVKKVVEKYGK